MKKLYTGLGIIAMILLSTSAFSQQKISSDQIQPILNKLDAFGKLNPIGAFPLDKLSKEDYALYKAYKMQEQKAKKHPYGITDQDLKNKVSANEVQPILNKIKNLGDSPLAFPDHLFTTQELKTLRMYELQNLKPQKASASKVLNKAYALNGRSAARPFGTMSLVPPHTLTQTGTIPLPRAIFADDIAGDGKLYALDNANRNLLTVNNSGVVTEIGNVTNIPVAATLSGLSWDSFNSKMYVAVIDAGAGNLYTINLTTGVATFVGPMTGMAAPIWLEIDNAGNAFSADISTDKLYSVNLTTGASTEIGALGHNMQFAQQADFNRETNVLYAASYTGGGVGGIYTINTTTGAATLVGDTTPDNAEYTMFSITTTTEPPLLNKAFFKNSNSNYPVEFGSMPLTPPHTVTSIAPLAGSLFSDDMAGDGNLYALNNSNNFLVKVYSNGTTSNVGPLTNLVSGHSPTGLSWNRANNKMYAASAAAGGGGTLYTVDLATGTLTVVGPMTGMQIPIWLEIDNAGLAYSADIITTKLYSVNLATGTATEIGDLGIDINFAQEADFNTANNVLYMAGFLQTQESNIYTVNTTTGAATLVGSTNGNELTMFTIADTIPDAPVLPPLTCGNTFYDTGGAAANYGNDEDIVTHIAPSTPGEAVTITFTLVDIETVTVQGDTIDCWDYLSIYNGPTINSPTLAETKCGEPGNTSSIPGILLSVGDSFTSTDASGQLTVRFRSDASFNRAGWAATISCAALAVDNVNATKFSYYPNPTTGILNLTASGKIENVEVYNMVGQKVMSFVPKANQSQLNMSTLAKGVYLVKALVNGKVITNKVIKQ